MGLVSVVSNPNETDFCCRAVAPTSGNVLNRRLGDPKPLGDICVAVPQANSGEYVPRNDAVVDAAVPQRLLYTSQVPSRPSRRDVAYDAVANPKSACNRPEALSCEYAGEYPASNHSVANSGMPAAFAPDGGPVPLHIVDVFLPGSPRQVGEHRIRPASIAVQALRPVRPKPNESLKDEVVDVPSCRPPAPAETQSRVAPLLDWGPEGAAPYRDAVAILPHHNPIKAPDATEVADFVQPFVPNNCFPVLHALSSSDGEMKRGDQARSFHLPDPIPTREARAYQAPTQK